MRSQYICFLLISSFTAIGFAQEDRNQVAFENIAINGDTLWFYHYSEMPWILPNKPIHLIIAEFENLGTEEVAAEYARMDTNEKWHVVFIKLPPKVVTIKSMDNYLELLFKRYFFDRNRVHITVKDVIDPKEFGNLERFLPKVASLSISEEQAAFYQELPKVYSNQNIRSKGIWKQSRSAISFREITIKEMTLLSKEVIRPELFLESKGRHILAVTSGYFQVPRSRFIGLDEETMVNLRDFNALWTLSYDYMISQRIGLGLNLGFLLKKDEESFTETSSDATVIGGSVSGGAVFKFGIATRYLAYRSKKIQVFPSLTVGNISATIGGGSGGATISESGISTIMDQSDPQKQTAAFVEMKLGVNYKLGYSFFVHGNLFYTHSNFSENYGSVSGFEGAGFNLGLGFTF